MNAVIYVRISDDRQGQGLGVARQEKECRALCQQKHLEVSAVLVDNDHSAYSGKPRPQYNKLIEGLKANTWDVVVAWHPDRVHRSPVELEAFIDVIEATGAGVETVTAGAYDLSTATGRMTARVVGAVARHESEQKSERIRSKHRELAEAGKQSGNGRTYGFTADRVTHIPEEVALLRDVARQLLDGVTLRAIVADLNTRGVPTARGGPWRVTSLRRMLTSERSAGYRLYGGKLIKATWEPILDEITWKRLRALLLDPNRRSNHSPRTYLLTGGVALCGLCGAVMISRPNGDKKRCYVCARDTGGCGKIRCLAEPLEEHVRGMVARRLQDGVLPAVDILTTEIFDDIDVCEANLAELATDYYADRTISKAQFQAASATLTGRLQHLRSTAAASEARARTPLDTDAIAVLDDIEPTARQRAIIKATVESVVVGRAVRGRNFYEQSRTTISFL